MASPAVAVQQTPGVRVSATGLSRVFANGVMALNDLDLEVSPGEFLSIVGPSGCGKSTLLRLIAGLDRPQRGRIGLEPHGSGADLAFVFQDSQLLPWRTVLRNVALPLELRGVEAALRTRLAAEAIARVGLADAIDRYPNQLSGGMKMRVSLARAMVVKPRLLLMDEPFAALDEITRQHLDEQLRALWRSRGMTTIFVTHSLAEAVFLSERVMVMSARPGRFVADRMIDLPDDRTYDLRGTPRYAEQIADLLDTLREQSGGGHFSPSPGTPGEGRGEGGAS